MTVTLRGYLISIAYCLFFHLVTIKIAVSITLRFEQRDFDCNKGCILTLSNQYPSLLSTCYLTAGSLSLDQGPYHTQAK